MGAGSSVAACVVGTTLGGAGVGTLGEAGIRSSTLGDDRLCWIAFDVVGCVCIGSEAGGVRSGKVGGSGSGDFQCEKMSFACWIAWSWFS